MARRILDFLFFVFLWLSVTVAGLDVSGWLKLAVFTMCVSTLAAAAMSFGRRLDVCERRAAADHKQGLMFSRGHRFVAGVCKDCGFEI